MFIVHKTIKYFVPQLTICVVFAPLKRRTPAIHQEIEETDVLSHMDTPVCVCVCVCVVCLRACVCVCT